MKEVGGREGERDSRGERERERVGGGGGWRGGLRERESQLIL